MSVARAVLELHDLDLLLELAHDATCRRRLQRAGFGFTGLEALERERERLLGRLERRVLFRL